MGCAVESCHKAIHLCTGDRGTDGAISTWLDCHDVEIVSCADPFEACVLALTDDAVPPDLALIGIDWLPPDEYSIISYFRETWPGLTIVVYGNTPTIVEFEKMPLTIVCRCANEIRRMLANTPGMLVKRSLEAMQAQSPADDRWRPQPTEPVRAAELRPLEAPPAIRPSIKTKKMETAGADPSPKADEQDVDKVIEPRPPITQAILTREELAALLEDDK